MVFSAFDVVMHGKNIPSAFVAAKTVALRLGYSPQLPLSTRMLIREPEGKTTDDADKATFLALVREELDKLGVAPEDIVW